MQLGEGFPPDGSGVIGIVRLEDLMEAYHREIQNLKET